MSPGQNDLPLIDPLRMRQVLAQVPTAVTVLTAMTPEGPAGVVIGSFVSISLNPPLVGAFADEKSTTWPRIAPTGSFAINVLADDQHELCARFATSGGDKFRGLQWTSSPQGHPLLPGTVAWLDCALHDVHKLGDHFLAIGRVLDLGGQAAARPLIFHRGSLRQLAAAS